MGQQPKKFKLRLKPLLLTIGIAGVGGLLVTYLVLNLVLYPHRNPPVVSEPNWDSPQTRELAQRACFDCHSNETVWPWYASIPPYAMAIQRNVLRGRRTLNFSEWGIVRGEGSSYHEMAESILEGEMPPRDYMAQHPEAKLTRAEKQQLLDGLKATLANGGGASAVSEDDEHEEEYDD